MVKDVKPEVTPDVADEDVEGNAFKWDVQRDANGRSRLRQGWDPADGPAGSRQPTKSGIEQRPSQEGR
jgi:hypothetical protein